MKNKVSKKEKLNVMKNLIRSCLNYIKILNQLKYNHYWGVVKDIFWVRQRYVPIMAGDDNLTSTAANYHFLWYSNA